MRSARHVLAVLLALAMALASGCRESGRSSTGGNESVNRRPIEQVLAEHTPRLMAIPGVVGTYQGAGDDGAPCIAIMVVKLTPALRDSLPPVLEGWPVRVEETGEIEPMGGGG